MFVTYCDQFTKHNQYLNTRTKILAVKVLVCILMKHFLSVSSEPFFHFNLNYATAFAFLIPLFTSMVCLLPLYDKLLDRLDEQ